MKNLFNTICLVMFISTCSSFVAAADKQYENLKINVLDEDFIVNMPSSVVAKKLTKIRKKYGVKLDFFGATNLNNDSNWLIDMSSAFGDHKFDFYFNTLLNINNGSLVGIRHTCLEPAFYFDVEEELKDTLVEFSVKFGKPLYQNIGKKNGSIVWIPNGCKFEIKKSITGNNKTTNVFIEIVDEKRIRKTFGEDIAKLAQLLSDEESNIAESQKYRLAIEEALGKNEYYNALESCNNSIFFDPNNADNFISRAKINISLKDYKQAESDARQAFYILFKQESRQHIENLDKRVTMAFEIEAHSRLSRESIAMFEISSIKNKADFIISKYNPQSPFIYVIRALCARSLKRSNLTRSKEKDTYAKIICSDLKKACDFGLCEKFHEAQKDGECK